MAGEGEYLRDHTSITFPQSMTFGYGYVRGTEKMIMGSLLKIVRKKFTSM